MHPGNSWWLHRHCTLRLPTPSLQREHPGTIKVNWANSPKCYQPLLVTANLNIHLWDPNANPIVLHTHRRNFFKKIIKWEAKVSMNYTVNESSVRKKFPKTLVLMAEELIWAFANSTGGINSAWLVSSAPAGAVSGRSLWGYPWESLNYFCNILSLDKREHRVRNKRSGGHLLLRVVYAGLFPYYPELSVLDNWETKHPCFHSSKYGNNHKNHFE